MTHLLPELPSPCQQKSIETQVIKVIEVTEVVQRSLPSDYSINGQHISTGQARKRAIAVLIVLTNLMISFGVGITGGLVIGESLGVRLPSQTAWIPASYSLTSGAFIIMTGRLGSFYGHKKIMLSGAAWWTVWSLINAFCNNFIAFNVARASSGIGAAMIVPNAIAMISMTLPPGNMRNLSLGCFGAVAPVGGWLGGLSAGLLAELTPWKWLFIFMSILGLIVFGSLALLLPPEEPTNRPERMDWIGSILGVSGLIAFNFVVNQAPATRGSNPYEIVLLIISIVLLVTFTVWEYKFAKYPILPLSILRAPSFVPLTLVVIFSFMSYSTFIWYLVAWQQQVRHWSILSTSIGLSPIAICAATAAFLAAWLIPRMAAQWILAIGALAIFVAQIILATMPVQQSYWLAVFPATVIQSFCPDFIFTAAAIIASNSVQRSEQGVAASLIGTLQLYATSIGLGLAGIVEVHTNDHGMSSIKGYRSALYLGTGMAALALTISIFLVRMPKIAAQGWQVEQAVSNVQREKAESNSSPMV